MPRRGPHNVSPEGRRGLQRNGRRNGRKLLQDEKGLFAPGFLQSPRMRKTRIRNNEKLQQDERGIYAPGFHQRPEMQDMRRRNGERLVQEQKGVHAPGFHDRPEIKKAHRQNGLIQGNAAVKRGDGIHAPGAASLAGKRAYELGRGPFTKDNPNFLEWAKRGGHNQKLLHIMYGAHIQHHVNNDRRIEGKPCVFCDNPKSLPRWFFEKLKAEFRGGPL
jgi:hypothetical protein